MNPPADEKMTTTLPTNMEENCDDEEATPLLTEEGNVDDNNDKIEDDSDKIEDSSIAVVEDEQLSPASPERSSNSNNSSQKTPLEPVDVQICYENYTDLRTFLQTFGTIENFHAHVKRGDESLTQQNEPTVVQGQTGLIQTTHYRYEVPLNKKYSGESSSLHPNSSHRPWRLEGAKSLNVINKNPVVPPRLAFSSTDTETDLRRPGRPCKFDICPVTKKVSTNKTQKIWTPCQVSTTTTVKSNTGRQQMKRSSIFREVNGECGLNAMDLYEGKSKEEEVIRGPSVSSRGRKRMRSTRLLDL